MARKKMSNKQTSLFGNVTNMVSMDDYIKSRARTQHEKQYMNDLISAAHKLGLPCVHIEYYCGNKFYAKCCSDTPVFCPVCRKPVLVECHNRLNKKLSGHFDILGISWAIETKHKINKGKQSAKVSDRQDTKKSLYDNAGIPNLVVNESNDNEALNFLLDLRDKKLSESNKKDYYKDFLEAISLINCLVKSIESGSSDSMLLSDAKLFFEKFSSLEQV